jgi:hypothetical protein
VTAPQVGVRGENMIGEPEFMHKTDDVSLARACRLAVVKSCYRQKLITQKDAVDLLKGCLSPNKESTRYDDSRFLEVQPSGA